MSLWQNYGMESQDVKSWRGPQRLHSHTVLNFLWVTDPSETNGEACTFFPQEKNKTYLTHACQITHTISGALQTLKLIQRSLTKSVLTLIFRWANRTREDKSQPILHTLSSSQSSALGCLLAVQGCVPVLGDGLPDALIELLLDTHSPQIRVCGPSNSGSHTVADSSCRPTVILWRAV